MRRLAAAVALTVLCALSPAAQAPKSLFFTASDGTTIHHFEIAGKGSAVILIHGYSANAEGKWIKPTVLKFIDTHDT